MTPDEKIPDDIIWHQSGVNAKGEPFVQLLKGKTVLGQMSPEQARDHGHAILEAAEAAEQDAFIYDWVQRKLEMPPAIAGRLLLEFRQYRAVRTNKKGGPTRPGDWVMPPGHKVPDGD